MGLNGTEKLLHDFTYGADGGTPYNGLMPDGKGGFVGTSSAASTYDFGTVFKLDKGFLRKPQSGGSPAR